MTGSPTHRQTAQNALGGDPIEILCHRLSQQSRALWRFLLRNNADPQTVRATHVDRPGFARQAYKDARGETASVQARNLSQSVLNGSTMGPLIELNRIAMLRWAYGHA